MRIALARNTLLTLVATACLATTAGAGTPTPLGINRSAMPDTVRDWGAFNARVWRDGRVFIAGQPDSAALVGANAHGVGCIVNLRTPSEMSDRKRVPYDEAALAASLGLEYVSLPMGDATHPYTAAAVDSLAAVLARQDGNVLLHCTVGWRATHMWVAYLVRHQGWSFPEALARGEHIALTESPFSGLLGRPVTLELAP
jgi:protein tyrosine phosphatase (PTP) superfamily phosphohydrolase (DUF442 family)